jgi:hypothetical protein
MPIGGPDRTPIDTRGAQALSVRVSLYRCLDLLLTISSQLMSASNVLAAAFRSAAFQVCEGLVDRVEGSCQR